MREVVGLGAAGGEHDLARAAAERARDRLPRLLDDPASLAPGAVQRARRCRPGRAGRVIAAAASGKIGVVAAWSR